MKYLTKFKSLSKRDQLTFLFFISIILTINIILTTVITYLIQVINPQMDFTFVFMLVGILLATSSAIICFYLGFKK